MVKLKNPQDLENLRKNILQEKYSEKPCIIISEKSTCCYLSGSKEVVEAFKEGLKNFDLEEEIDIKTTGCLGFCEIEPIIILEPKGILYQKVKKEDVIEIITETILNDIIIAIAKQKNIPITKEDRLLGVTGDHSSFQKSAKSSNSTLQAACFMSDKDSKYIHSTKDTPDRCSAEILNNCIELCYDTVRSIEKRLE